MISTKVFNSGNSQAMRIPKEYRFSQEDVVAIKIGSALIAYEADKRYDVLMESLNEFTDDFLSDGRPKQGKQQSREMFD